MLNLEAAEQIIDGALAHARSINAKQMAVIVLDDGGHPIAFKREDGATFFRLEIARAKAFGALGMGSDTAVLADRAKANPVFFGSLSAAVDGGLVFAAGGVLIKSHDDVTLGAVGVSGDSGDIDEACAKAGISLSQYRTGAVS